MIFTRCVSCNKKLKLDIAALGKNVRCPDCRFVFKVASVAPRDESMESGEDALVTRAKLTVPPSPIQHDNTSSPDDRVHSEPDINERQLPELLRIDRYEIKRVLGRGAFGVVYAGYDSLLGREVAIKLCLSDDRPTTVDSKEEAQLLSEARSAARLRHPNIVAVFEAGTHQGQVYVVSELVDGQTLADRISEGSVQPREAASLIRDLARGLEYAHVQKLVHRDVKPQNVLIDTDNRPQLTDFGLAFNRGNEEEFRQQAYAHSGTLAYMAPEQAGITGVSVGPLADQYALGATLFELLTGKRPHSGGPLEILQALEAKDPPRVRSLKPSIDFDLDAICFRAMSHQPWDRYESCEEFARDLERYIAGDLIKGRKIGVVERIRHFAKRRPQVAAWLAASAAIVLAVLSYTTGTAIRNSFVARELATDNAKLITENSRRSEKDNAISRDLSGSLGGRSQIAGDETAAASKTIAAKVESKPELPGWVAYSRKLQKASRSLSELELQLTDRLIEETLPRYRDWEYRFLKAAIGTPALSWRYEPPKDVAALSYPVNFLAMADPTLIGIHSARHFEIREIATGKQRFATKFAERSPNPPSQLFPLRDKPIALFSDDSTIRQWNYETSQEEHTLDIGATNQILAVTKDDRWLLVQKFVMPAPVPDETSAHGNQSSANRRNQDDRSLAVEIWDLQHVQRMITIPLEHFYQHQGGVAPSDYRVAQQQLTALSSADGSYFLITAGGNVFRLSLTPMLDNNVAADERKPVLVELPGDDVQTLLAITPGESGFLYIGSDSKLRQLAVSPYGSWETTVIRDDFIADWSVQVNAIAGPQGDGLFSVRRGQQLALLTKDFSLPLLTSPNYLHGAPAPAFSTNARFVIGYDETTIYAWELESILPKPLARTKSMVSAMGQSRDGTLAAIATQDGGVELWNTVQDTRLWGTPGDYSQQLFAVALHPTEPVIAVAGDLGRVRFLNLTDGQVVDEWSELPASINAMEFSPDGKVLAIGLSQQIPLKRQGPLPMPPAPVVDPAAQVAPKDAMPGEFGAVRLVSYQGPVADAAPPLVQHLLLKSWPKGETRVQHQAHDAGITSLAFSPDGSKLASSGEDGRVALWDVNQVNMLADYRCEPGGIPDELRFAPDGQKVAFVVNRGSATSYVSYARTRMVNVTKMRMETRTRNVSATTLETQTRTMERSVDYEGQMNTTTRTIEEQVPVTFQVEEAYTVEVPYTEIVAQVYTVCVPACLAMPPDATGESSQPTVAPHVVSATASDLKELARWYPEASATPQSLAFAADGERLYVTTDQGVSSLHPEHFFELVELRPQATRASTSGFDKVLFQANNEKLLVAGFSQSDPFGPSQTGVYALRPLRAFDEPTLQAELKRDRAPKLETVSASGNPAWQPPPPLTLGQWNGATIEIPTEKQENIATEPIKHERLASLAAVPTDRVSVWLSEVQPTSGLEWLPSVDATFAVGGFDYPAKEFLPAPAASVYQFELPDGWTTFTTQFAVASGQSRAAAVFVVRGDGRTLYRSPVIRDQNLHGIHLDIRGVKQLELVSEYVDWGRIRGVAAWLQPTVGRSSKTDVECYAVQFDEIRITAEDLDHCQMRLSDKGLERIDVKDSDPTLLVNGVAWKPKTTATLANAGNTIFVSKTADFRGARLHALRIGWGGNIRYKINQESIDLLFEHPQEGTTDFECVVQIPRREESLADAASFLTSLDWLAPWKVAGFEVPQVEGAAALPPAEISTKSVQPFSVADMPSIDWSWPAKRTVLDKTPESSYAIVGQRRFTTDGGYFRIEILGDGTLRVLLNGENIIDDWTLGSVRQLVSMVYLPKGTHTVRFEQFKNSGASRLTVDVKPLEQKQFAPLGPILVDRIATLPSRQEVIPVAALLKDDLARRSQSSPSPFDAVLERKAAEWVLGLGGELSIVSIVGERFDIKTKSELPEQDFYIDSVGLAYKPVADEDMANLVGLRRLRKLNLNYTQVSDTGVSLLGNISSLNWLSLTRTKVTGECFSAWGDLTSLHYLEVNESPIVDDSIISLSMLISLRDFHANNSKLTDNGIAHLAQTPALKILSLSNNASITNAAIARLSKLTELQTLFLVGVQVEEATIQELKSAAPNLQVHK